MKMPIDRLKSAILLPTLWLLVACPMAGFAEELTANPATIAEGSAYTVPPLPERLERREFRIPRAELNRMKDETILVLDFMQNNHFRGLSWASLPPKDIIDSFVDELDRNRLFMLESDMENIAFRFQETLIPVYLAKGNLYPAFEIYLIFRERALDRIDWVFQRLQQPLDLETDATFKPEREDMPRPQSPEEADALWEQRLAHEIIFDLLNDETMEQAISRLFRRYERIERFILNTEPHEVQENFLNAITGLYDPHSNFFSAQSAEDFNISISNSLVGIGAVLSDEDGYCTIRRLMPGGPAELSGQLHPGDKIVAVAQDGEDPVDVVDMKLSKVVQMIRGEKDSPVHLTILPADSSERRILTLMRDEIQLTAQLATATVHSMPGPDGNSTVPIGVIHLPSFYGDIGESNGATVSNTSDDVSQLIGKLRREHQIEGLVLDLRRNGGGLLTEAVKTAGLFITKGPVVQIKFTGGEVREDWDKDQAMAYDGPLAVLVDRNSASASEIVAGALQTLGRAIVIGDEATHGKGTVQAPWPLERSFQSFSPFRRNQNLGTVKVTVQKFYLPSGASTQKKGVLSDVAIPSINSFLPIGESDLDHAMEWDTIDPIDWNAGEVNMPAKSLLSDDLRDRLEANSEKRRSLLEEFTLLEKQIDLFRQHQDREEFSLNLTLRKAQREEDRTQRRELEKQLDALAAAFPMRSSRVDLAVTAEKEAEHQQKLRSVALPNGSPRPNGYYQKIFYYDDPAEQRIHEIDVQFFDYEELLEDSAAIARKWSERLDLLPEEAVPESAVEGILRTFFIADAGVEFKVEETIQSHLPHWTEPRLSLSVPAFFHTLVEFDKDILLDRSKLDIPLREALRVVYDWNHWLQDRPPSPAPVATTLKTSPKGVPTKENSELD